MGREPGWSSKLTGKPLVQLPGRPGVHQRDAQQAFWKRTAEGLQTGEAGGIRLPKKAPLAERLAVVYAELTAQIAAHNPDIVAIEEVFYSVNAKSALKLGQVRGVALLAAATARLPVAEYAPLKIKSTVTGYGLAQKEQVQFMVARLLRLEVVPEPADAADALAIAICHIQHAQTLARQGVSQ